MHVLVTGAAGFIGYHVTRRLLERGDTVVGLDNLNAYYDPALKHARLQRLESHSGFVFRLLSLEDRSGMEALFESERPARVVHLGAQAGVRYSISDPHAYVQTNLVGFLHVLEGCRRGAVEHLVYASSSSVYGSNTKLPFSTADPVDHPVSLYAATKKSNELMAHVYAHLHGLPVTGLRFFTVYGPWGRPDMALFKFTRAILAGEPIEVYNFGKMRRDFTYVDDIVEGVVRVLDRAPAGTPPYSLFNIGNNQPVELERFIEALEQCLGKQATRVLMPLQPGDVPDTYADVDDLATAVGFRPATPISEGIARFVEWYRSHYAV